MARVKEAMEQVSKNGRAALTRGKTSEEDTTSKRWVRPLYPSEPTTIDKAILDKAIDDAIEKRLRSMK